MRFVSTDRLISPTSSPVCPVVNTIGRIGDEARPLYGQLWKHIPAVAVIDLYAMGLKVRSHVSSGSGQRRSCERDGADTCRPGVHVGSTAKAKQQRVQRLRSRAVQAQRRLRRCRASLVSAFNERGKPMLTELAIHRLHVPAAPGITACAAGPLPRRAPNHHGTAADTELPPLAGKLVKCYFESFHAATFRS